MPHWKRQYSTEHLDAIDIPEGREITIKILSVGSTELDGDKGKERKGLIRFEPSPAFGKLCSKRTWVPAKTCGYCMAAMFGDLDENWIGKRVTLHAERIETGDEAIRVVGSPDITREIKLRVRVFGAGKKTLTMKPTAQARSNGQKPQTDPGTGEQVPPPSDDQPEAG